LHHVCRMQLQRNRPINPQKHLDFVKRDDAFFSSLAAAKTKKVRIAHKMYLIFMQPNRFARCGAFAVAKAAPFCRARAQRRSCPRFSDENIRARRAGGETVPLRHGWDEVPIVNQSDDEFADIVGRRVSPTRHHPRMRVIQYSRDVSD